ncbi:hypothetical protein GPECTOR_7g1338 [Gonium pectorale]|uniref:Restriction endonuclease n=1 Tax=Gonium pectorale TaxID=33097 RepID=A0A150GVR5_GONPE|nr:hypothetical protein GPECTOR_7g1338 [Gonium pectorale]|eukprot:KXZ53440.1 hypothetical protein GPECTOR_7g1338 [Gonium pectorale]
MEYPVFRKVFHIPSKWMENEHIRYLVEHTYAKENTDEALQMITSKLKELGYMEDNAKMVHDYLCFMTQDLLDKNGEVYVTEDDIRESEPIKRLMGGMTPDFAIKKRGNRDKTIILDVYVGNKDPSDVKGKYKTLGFFADLHIVTQYNFNTALKCVLPEADLEYMHKNVQLFLTEYFYWRACIKLRKVLLNDVENIQLQQFATVPDEQQTAKLIFKEDLIAYAKQVADQARI